MNITPNMTHITTNINTACGTYKYMLPLLLATASATVMTSATAADLQYKPLSPTIVRSMPPMPNVPNASSGMPSTQAATNYNYANTNRPNNYANVNGARTNANANINANINPNTYAASTYANQYHLPPNQARIPNKATPEIIANTNPTKQPPKFATATPAQVAGLPMPTASVSNIIFKRSITIPIDIYGTKTLDVTKLDEFLIDVRPNARHYPSNFPNRTQQYNTRETIKAFVTWITPFASAPDASFDILIRSAQLNGMARNLDLGSEYAVRASEHVSKALKLNPNSVEANLLYGIMLAEGGGFKTGRKYLDRAVELGSVEAQQSIAQADLLNDQAEAAMMRLQQLSMQYPDNAMIKKQIAIIEGGGYYIWNIPDKNINVKAIN